MRDGRNADRCPRSRQPHARPRALVERLGDSVDFYKIGYQLFYGGDGLALGKALIAAGKRVFFDLKLLDIDNTVEKGAAAIAATGATFLTVHAYPKAMRAAAKAAAGSGLGILGVTVLTSMDDAIFATPATARARRARRDRRAQQAHDAGIAGVVCFEVAVSGRVRGTQ